MGASGASVSGLRPVAAECDGNALARACGGFHAAYPAYSAKRVLTWAQLAFLLALGAGVGWAIAAHPMWAWRTVHAVAFALFAVAIFWRLFAAASLTPIPLRVFTPKDGHWPIYTILCPLHRESAVVFDLVAALARLDYPRHALDIQFLVEADDPDTIAAAIAATMGTSIEVVIVPAAAPRTKPKALNIGLERARGDFVTVYDAEDRPHPLQLRAALAAFHGGGETLACAQAPLAVDNAGRAWIAGQFAAEYAIQFQEILPLLARLKLPLPLGGTSNHFRTETLRGVGGWDPHNVTEDADLGYRIARAGLHADVIAPPTWEEAPVRFGAWLNQRTRWIKGHLQTWLVLMRNPFRAAREMGAGAFWSMQLVLAGGVAACLLHGPLALLLVASVFFDILGPADFVLALFGYVVAAFSALSATALSRDWRHARAALTMPFYWPLASIAACKALIELALRPHHWAKTAHGVSPRAAIHLAAEFAASEDQRSVASRRRIASISASP